MSADAAYIFWAGLLALNPICLGLFPASSNAASSRPEKAWPYALVGSLTIFLFSSLAWSLRLLLNQKPGLAWIELPVQLLLLAGLNYLLALALRPWPALSEQLPLFHLNFPALVSGLLLLAQPLTGWGPALLTAAGMALGFGLSLILASFARERLETRRFSTALAGWPLFLLLAAVIWISCRGLMMVLTN
jgi:Na+-translocating ferredoxin:NAD+ oxidoreductase RnfA subunit